MWDVWCPSVVVILLPKNFSQHHLGTYTFIQKTVCPNKLKILNFSRTTALGTASAFARIGSMSSPFIDLLSEYQDGLSLAVYGSFLLLGTICSIFVWPETKSLKMIESIEECEKLARGKNKWLRCNCCA